MTVAIPETYAALDEIVFYHHKIIKETCGNVASFHVSVYFTVHMSFSLNILGIILELDINFFFSSCAACAGLQCMHAFT